MLPYREGRLYVGSSLTLYFYFIKVNLGKEITEVIWVVSFAGNLLLIDSTTEGVEA